MKVILTILFFVTFSFSQQLVRLSTGIVEDLENGLMWIDNQKVIEIQLKHKEAILYCEELNYNGFNNWRIPTIEEFQIVADKDNEKNHYINEAFKHNINKGFWAKKAHFRTLWFYADYMNFVSGTPYFDNRNVYKYVRCVRDIK